MSRTNRDSELNHSFGPNEIGFDFLPLEASNPDIPLPTKPRLALPVFDLASDTKALPPTAPAPGSAALSTLAGPPPAMRGGKTNGAAPAKFWLDGDTVLCACPDCKAPISVRIWLMLAECWRCGSNVELTEEQEREVRQLLEARSAPAAKAAPPPAPKPQPAAKPAAFPPAVAAPAVATPVAKAAPAPAKPTPASQPAPAQAPARFREGPAAPPKPSPQPKREPATPPVAPAPAPAARTAPAAEPATPPTRPAAPSRAPPLPPKPEPEGDLLSRVVRDTPAWLVSMLVHLILLTLLAMFNVSEDEKNGPLITLSSNWAREPREGEDAVRIPPDQRAKFDLPLPPKTDLNDPAELKVMLQASQDARELRVDDAEALALGTLEAVQKKVASADGVKAALSARDPRLRVQMVAQEGGTTLTEAAVARGLRWLSMHQNNDGSWRLRGFTNDAGCNCGGEGSLNQPAPGTALAMLPFLGAGQTHLTGRYKDVVGGGLRWLIEHQKENGDLRAGDNGNSGMYAHGQATIVLCEAFAMTGDEQLRAPAQRAVDFVVKAQYRDGGWRYQPGPASLQGDTSVVGWQLMALQSARAANLTVPDTTLLRASTYLDGCAHSKGALYSYTRGSGPTATMTAEGLLCRMYLGWNKRHDALGRGVRQLVEEFPPSLRDPNIYYWYYGTQTMHHYGGEEWERWNNAMREVLTQSQEKEGHRAGSWTPRGPHSEAGGRIYMTALSVCSLEVYYRHLPIFRQIKLD